LMTRAQSITPSPQAQPTGVPVLNSTACRMQGSLSHGHRTLPLDGCLVVLT
jgi:hypothetical protein